MTIRAKNVFHIRFLKKYPVQCEVFPPRFLEWMFAPFPDHTLFYIKICGTRSLVSL